MSGIVDNEWSLPVAQGPRRTYVEIFMRHKLIATLPLVVVLAATVLYLSSLPTAYVADSTMWVDAPLPNESTIIIPSPAGHPSGIAAEVLTQMLGSHDFAVRTATRVLGREATDEEAARLIKGVAVRTMGPQLIGISARQAFPELAMGTAEAVANEFTVFVTESLAKRQAEAAEYYGALVLGSRQRLDGATAQVAEYNAQHPGIDSDTDPVATQLAANVAQAAQEYAANQQAYSAAQEQAAQAALVSHEGTGVAGVPRLLDAPETTYEASRKKAMIFGGAGGLVAGIALSAVVLTILMAADRSVRSESDLEALLDMEIVGIVDELSSKSFRQSVSP